MLAAQHSHSQQQLTFFNTNFFISGSNANNERDPNNQKMVSRKDKEVIILPSKRLKRVDLMNIPTEAARAGADLSEFSSFAEEGDQSPRDYVKVYEVECDLEKSEKPSPAKNSFSQTLALKPGGS